MERVGRGARGRGTSSSGWLRHRRTSCDSYLIHGHAGYILCRTTYEYRSIAVAAPPGPEEIIGASAYMDISITRSYARRAAARTREEARRPRRGPARRDTSHYDSSGVCGYGFRARIRRGGERYLSGNNLRDKSPICIDASCPVMRDDAA